MPAEAGTHDTEPADAYACVGPRLRGDDGPDQPKPLSLIPVLPAFETMGPPRLTRGRCRRALQCETRAARRWRPVRRPAPGKNDEDGDRLSPAAVPGDPFGGAGRGRRVPSIESQATTPCSPPYPHQPGRNCAAG